MKTKSQKQQILELLLKGWYLTKIQMLEKVGCWNSGEAIRQLRLKGYEIKTRMETNKVTGNRYAVYFIPKYAIILYTEND